MKKIALAILLLLPLAASADPAGDYEALVAAAKEGDPGVDYMALRQAYVEQTEARRQIDILFRQPVPTYTPVPWGAAPRREQIAA